MPLVLFWNGNIAAHNEGPAAPACAKHIDWVDPLRVGHTHHLYLCKMVLLIFHRVQLWQDALLSGIPYRPKCKILQICRRQFPSGGPCLQFWTFKRRRDKCLKPSLNRWNSSYHCVSWTVRGKLCCTSSSTIQFTLMPHNSSDSNPPLF